MVKSKELIKLELEREFFEERLPKWKTFSKFIHEFEIILNDIPLKNVDVEGIKKIFKHYSIKELDNFRNSLNVGFRRRFMRKKLFRCIYRRWLWKQVSLISDYFVSLAELNEFIVQHKVTKINRWGSDYYLIGKKKIPYAESELKKILIKFINKKLDFCQYFDQEYLKFKIETKKRRIKYDVWEEAKNICEAKKIDIYTKGLLIHSTPRNWTRKEVEQFPIVGLESPSRIGKIDQGGHMASFNPDYISFSMVRHKYEYATRVNFIINPDYVKASGKFYYFLTDENKYYFENYLAQYSKGIKIKKYEKFPKHHNFEFFAVPPIPFSAIIGIVVGGYAVNEIKHLMTKLIERSPKLAIPVYNKQGEMIFP